MICAEYLKNGIVVVNAMYYVESDGVTDRIRSCRGCVADCARIVEYMLFSKYI